MTTRLDRTHMHFRSRLRKIDGQEFFGQILNPPDTSRVSNFLSARRYLRVSPKSGIAPRDVVLVAGKPFIVAEHASGFYVTEIYRHFKLFEADWVAEVFPARRVMNPVSGVLELTRIGSDGEIYMSTQPALPINDQINIPVNQVIVATNYDLKIDDMVGPSHLVTKVDTLLGVTVATLRGL